MIVIDANAAIAIALGTVYGDGLKQLRLEDERIAAPSLLCAEVSHAMAKYVRGGYLTAAEALDCGRDAISLVDDMRDDGDLWAEALTESVRLGHSSYDLFYLVLARREGATLFTVDRKLQGLCARNGVNCIWLDREF
ncbi:type II toxin-antitoxin system VapC family toxin [Adlercreutzia caecimuris]|uniref:type II toxin-antitoxin system VapC family toxin n=1 Tax=Adlercreutzia caecimuris TaxID=671266 RepID=UPI001C3E760B|nr:type II toxin-antitoxin system VapC family toxin [Adlercreutzia caecimuris]